MQKNNRLIMITLILLITGSVVGAQDSGYLSVSAGDSMQIYIDTLFVGEKQISYLQIPIGTYTVHVYNPYCRNWSDRGWAKQIEIRSGEHFELNMQPAEQIKITSIPFSSNVFSGNDLLGQTPLLIERKSVSDQTLRIENRGYQDKTFSLVQGTNNYTVSLDPLRTGTDKSAVARMNDTQYQIKWYREGLVVTSLLSSWASFYFKRQADDYYEKYQRASDSREMIALYSDTQRFDRMSDIAIAVSAVTLGTYLYLLLLD